MENATKALIIAASTLIALMIITVFVFIFRKGASVNEKYDSDQSQLSLESYNSKFETYDKSNNSIVDIISLINLIYDVNSSSDYDKATSISLSVKDGTNEILRIPSELNVDNSLNLRRNQIFIRGKIVSTLNLLDSSLETLNIKDSDEKLTESKLLTLEDQTIGQSYQYRLYKYTFNSTGFLYHRLNNSSNGKVASASFIFNENGSFDSIRSLKIIGTPNNENPTTKYLVYLDMDGREVMREIWT